MKKIVKEIRLEVKLNFLHNLTLLNLWKKVLQKLYQCRQSYDDWPRGKLPPTLILILSLTQTLTPTGEQFSSRAIVRTSVPPCDFYTERDF